MRRHISLLLAATLGVALAACSSDSSNVLAPSDANITGTFSLTVADGQVLPYFAFTDGVSNYNVVTDKLTIFANNTWIDSTSYSLVSLSDGSVTSESDGTAGVYQVVNGTINFVKTIPDTIAFRGSVTNNTLTVLDGANKKYVYTR